MYRLKDEFCEQVAKDWDEVVELAEEWFLWLEDEPEWVDGLSATIDLSKVPKGDIKTANNVIAIKERFFSSVMYRNDKGISGLKIEVINDE